MIKKLFIVLLASLVILQGVKAQPTGGGSTDGGDSPFADGVWIDDTGGCYASDNVEGALQEICADTFLMPPVETWYDPTGGLPGDPEVGDRYIAEYTGNGWTQDYIYEWDGSVWVESEPEDGWMVWDLFELIMWIFFSGGWMEEGSGSYWSLDDAQLGIIGDKTGSFNLTTSGLGTFNSGVSTDEYVEARDKLILNKDYYTGAGGGGYLAIGEGYDLKLYHTGTDSTIKNTTGDLIIDNTGGSGDIVLEGLVGIGTTAPRASLEILGGGTTALWIIGDTDTRMVIGDTTSGSDYGELRWDTSSDYLGLDADGTQYLILQEDGGNVGIGTATPGYKLDVQGGAIRQQGSAGVDGYLLTNSGDLRSETNLNPGILVFHGTAGNDYGMDLGYNSGTSKYRTRIFTNNNQDIAFGKLSSPATAQSDFTEWMTIEAGGNVGIGTTNPQSALDVVGDIIATGNIGLGNTAPTYEVDIEKSSTIGSTGTFPGIKVSNINVGGAFSLSDVFVAAGNGAVQMRLFADGLGTSTLTGGTIAGSVGTKNNVPFFLTTGNQDRVKIDTALVTFNDSVDIGGSLDVTGTGTFGAVTLADYNRILFGTGLDASIYFDGDDMVITSEGETSDDELLFRNFDLYKFDNDVETTGTGRFDGGIGMGAGAAPAGNLKIDVRSDGSGGVNPSQPTIRAYSNDGSGTAAAGILEARGNNARLIMVGHGDGRTISRWGRSIARTGEIITFGGAPLAIGTNDIQDTIIGTHARAAITINGSTQNIAINQKLRIGSTAAPTVALDVVGDAKVSGTLSADSLVVTGGKVRSSTANYRRYYHTDLASLDPGASGATFTMANGNTIGGWQMTTSAHDLHMDGLDIHADWDAASDIQLEIRFEINTASNLNDTVDLRAVCYYKGVGEVVTKTQTVEVAINVGDGGGKAQFYSFEVDLPIDYNIGGGNNVEVGDEFFITINLETDTSEVDNIIVNSISTHYDTTHTGIEDGDI